jgi:hypothetical protein
MRSPFSLQMKELALAASSTSFTSLGRVYLSVFISPHIE